MSLLNVRDVVGDDRYIIEEELGRGGMQEVYRAHDDTLNRKVALKVPQDHRAARKFRESAVLSAKVNHPNVAKTLDYFEDENNRFYMVEELIDGKNLRQVASRFARFDPHTAIHVLHHLARGVAASHSADVVHRDLKPSNIMVAGALAFMAVKITDFGIAKMAAHEIDEAVSGGEETTKSSRTVMNALAYVAPEVVNKPRTASKPADVWAIAAMAWELLTGSPPFGTGLKAAIKVSSPGLKTPDLPREVAKHPQFGGLSVQLRALIDACLQVEPNSRPTAADLASSLDTVCYLQPFREVGTVRRYVYNTAGFIESESGSDSFFNVRNVIGGKPEVGTRVWYTKFDGRPAPRAIPVVPMKPDPEEE